MRISDWSSDVCSSDLVPRSVEVLVQKLIEHFILVFLESDCPHVVLIDQGHKYDINHIFQREYKSSASSHKFQIEGHHFTLHGRSEEHTSELQSLMRIPYAVFCLKKTKNTLHTITPPHHHI